MFQDDTFYKLTYLLTCFMDLTEIHIYKPIIYNNWWRGSVLRTSDFPWSMPDLWLTCDHFVGKVYTMGQPTRPTQPTIPSGSVNE